MGREGTRKVSTAICYLAVGAAFVIGETLALLAEEARLLPGNAQAQ